MVGGWIKTQNDRAGQGPCSNSALLFLTLQLVFSRFTWTLVGSKGITLSPNHEILLLLKSLVRTLLRLTEG